MPTQLCARLCALALRSVRVISEPVNPFRCTERHEPLSRAPRNTFRRSLSPTQASYLTGASQSRAPHAPGGAPLSEIAPSCRQRRRKDTPPRRNGRTWHYLILGPLQNGTSCGQRVRWSASADGQERVRYMYHVPVRSVNTERARQRRLACEQYLAILPTEGRVLPNMRVDSLERHRRRKQKHANNRANTDRASTKTNRAARWASSSTDVAQHAPLRSSGKRRVLHVPHCTRGRP